MCQRGFTLLQGEKARAEIGSEFDVAVRRLDLSKLNSVRAFAKSILSTEDRVDILVNNAGVYGIAEQRTEEGFEMHMAVHHFGHFLLTNLLLDKIRRNPDSRIINVSSASCEFGNLDLEDLHYERKTYNRK